MLVVLGKDLRLSWVDNPPAWWPSNRAPRMASVIKKLYFKIVYYINIGQWTKQMKEVLQYLYAHYWITNIDEYVAAAYQYAIQITKKSYDTPERPFTSTCYNRLYIGRSQFLATAYVSIKAFTSEKEREKTTISRSRCYNRLYIGRS